jgi:hypothetical protein
VQCNLTQSLFTEDHGPAGLPGDQWSEFAFLVNYLNASVIDANAVAGGSGDHNILELVSLSLIVKSEILDLTRARPAVL